MTDDDDIDDDEPDPLAAIDQLVRGLSDFARIIWAHYAAMVDQGFTADQALELSIAYQTTLQQSAG